MITLNFYSRITLLVLILVVSISLPMGCSGDTPSFFSERRLSVHVYVDMTDSTKYLRQHESFEPFFKALNARPEYEIKIYGQRSDYLSPIKLSEALSVSVGQDDDGNWTGGDLENVVRFAEASDADLIILLTDGENNLRNAEGVIQHSFPSFNYPEKFIIIGVLPEFYQTYHQMGVKLISLEEIPALTRRLVSEGKLF